MTVNPSLDISQFDYELPPALIAQAPAAERTASRLLRLDAQGALHDLQFASLPALLRPNDLLVFNDTRVIKARLLGRKASGGKIEVLVERITGARRALAHVKASKSPKPGANLLLADDAVTAQVLGREGELFELDFPDDVLTLLDRHGATPLPPYITHAADAGDDARYQTVYAREPGAVAAPTAGLHFDDAMLARLDAMGVQRAWVTLHVGAGTFQPVRGSIAEHVMHAERFCVPTETLRKAHAARQAGGRVIAVGTTSVRAMESAAASGAALAQPAWRSDSPAAGDSRIAGAAAGAHAPGIGAPAATPTPASDAAITGDTRLFITPGYRYAWIDALITNFHLPQSTLLMLVSALAGVDPIRRAYAHAVAERYRFFSYGDAMFIESPASAP